MRGFGVVLMALVLGGTLLGSATFARAQESKALPPDMECPDSLQPPPDVPVLSGPATLVLVLTLGVLGAVTLGAGKRPGRRAAGLACVAVLLAAAVPAHAQTDDPAPSTDQGKNQAPDTKIERYDLAGATLAQAAANFPYPDEANVKRAGKTDVNLSHSITWEACTRQKEGGWGADVKAVVEWKLEFVIHLPKWQGFADAPKNHQAEWTRFSKALEEHEQGHVAVSKAALAKGVPKVNFEAGGNGATKQAAIDAAKAAIMALVEAEADRLWGPIMADNQTFDAETDHGATTGASLDTDP